MSKKQVKIGSVIRQDGGRFCIGLGYTPKQVTDKNRAYVRSVEIIVRDADGKVIAQQENGFINVQNPRTYDEELFQKGVISESEYNKRKENPPTIPEKIAYNLIMTPAKV